MTFIKLCGMIAGKYYISIQSFGKQKFWPWWWLFVSEKYTVSVLFITASQMTFKWLILDIGLFVLAGTQLKLPGGLPWFANYEFIQLEDIKPIRYFELILQHHLFSYSRHNSSKANKMCSERLKSGSVWFSVI